MSTTRKIIRLGTPADPSGNGFSELQSGEVIDPSQLDVALSALAGVTPGVDQLPYYTGTTTASVTGISAFGRAALATVDAAAFRELIGAEAALLDNFSATTAPTANDDSGDGYNVGSVWINAAAKEIYVCSNATPGAAVWINVLNRASHKGTQTAATISDFATAASAAAPVKNVFGRTGNIVAATGDYTPQQVGAEPAGAVAAHTAAADPHGQYVLESTIGQANGVVPLDASGKVSTAYLPSMTLTDVHVVASEAEQLALAAQQGDVAVRTDLNTSYVHNGGTSGTMADWQALQTPTNAVLSVFGRTGTVTAQAGDYSAVQIANTPAGNLLATTVQAALNELDSEKAPLVHAHAHTEITGFTEAAQALIAAAAPSFVGGASVNLAYDGILNTVKADAVFGTTAGTVAEGNHTHSEIVAQYFTEMRNVDAPNHVVPVHALAAIGVEADIDVVLAPKGAGAIIAQVPDGLDIGGEKRGPYAVDLQCARELNTQVASGEFSFSVGAANTAAGKHSAAMGLRNVVGVAGGVSSEGEYSFAAGTDNNVIGQSSFASGAANIVSGNFATAFGQFNDASGNHGLAIGELNLVGSYARALGYQCIASGDMSTAIGNKAVTRDTYGVYAYASGAFGTEEQGTAQLGTMALRCVTTDATAQVLTSDGNIPSSVNLDVAPFSKINVAILPDNHTYSVMADVTAFDSANHLVKHWVIRGTVKRGVSADATTLVGSPVKTVVGADQGADAWNCNLVVNTVRGSAEVEVVGVSSSTIRWVCKFDTVEVG